MAKKILLVDDDRMTRSILSRILDRYAPSFNLVTVESGKEAIAQLEEGSFDLIISDLMRPEIDGRELHRLVRNDKTHERVPFLFVTGMTLPPPTDPNDHVLPKPFSAKEVLGRIRQILGEGPGVKTQRLSKQDLEKARQGTRLETTRFIARRFQKRFENRYVRIIQHTSNPVDIDLIQKHLLFSHVLSEYNLSRYLIGDVDEVSLEVHDVPELPGRHALHFYQILRSENPRLPTERVLIPEIPEFLLARKAEELTIDQEIERTVEYLRAVYLSNDLEIPADAALGQRFAIQSLEVLSHDIIDGEPLGNVRLHLSVERKHRYESLSDWANNRLEEILQQRDRSVDLCRTLIEASLGLEELTSFFPERTDLSKASAYLTATSLLVRSAASPQFRGSSCPQVTLGPDDIEIRGIDLGEGESLVMDDPYAKVFYDDDHWAGLLHQYFFPASESPGYKMHAIRFHPLAACG